MTPTKGMRAAVILERWSGHGEGGSVVRVVIKDRTVGNPYDSTPEDIKQAERDAEYINSALEYYELHRNR